MSSFGAKILTGGVLAVIGLLTIRFLVWLFGLVTGLLSFLLFTVLPIAILAWLAVKIFKYLTRERSTA